MPYSSEVKQRIHKGMQQSLFNADLGWRVDAEEVVNTLIKHRHCFTSDDVLLELERRGKSRSVNNSALGGIIKRAADADKIEPFGFEPSKRPSRHGAPVRVWRSKVYRVGHV